MRPNTHSFIIRIWHEAVDEQGQVTTWRGYIEHVNSGQRLSFDQLDEFVEFIRGEIGLENVESASWWRSLLT